MRGVKKPVPYGDVFDQLVRELSLRFHSDGWYVQGELVLNCGNIEEIVEFLKTNFTPTA